MIRQHLFLVMQQIAQMQRHPETQVGQTSTPTQTQTPTSNLVQPVQQMPNQPETPGQTLGLPSDVPV